jgi:hypothetical protein
LGIKNKRKSKSLKFIFCIYCSCRLTSLFLLYLLQSSKSQLLLPYLSIFALAKFVFDFLLLFLASDFLGRTKYIWWIIPFECVYWIYALSIVGTNFMSSISRFGKAKKLINCYLRKKHTDYSIRIAIAFKHGDALKETRLAMFGLFLIVIAS